MIQATGGKTIIQLNDKIVNTADITDYVAEERERMSPEDIQAMSVSIKADRGTDMGTISDVKQALRKAGALRISYSATQKDVK